MVNSNTFCAKTIAVGFYAANLLLCTNSIEPLPLPKLHYRLNSGALPMPCTALQT